MGFNSGFKGLNGRRERTLEMEWESKMIVTVFRLVGACVRVAVVSRETTFNPYSANVENMVSS